MGKNTTQQPVVSLSSAPGTPINAIGNHGIAMTSAPAASTESIASPDDTGGTGTGQLPAATVQSSSPVMASTTTTTATITPAPATPSIATLSIATPSTPKKTAKASTKSRSAAASSSGSSLIICRNKHWRFISSFHGPWLQMPIEVLETIANINYNTPRPRPIDPATFFDLVKVRRLVDEATNLAVRAASDIASPTLTSLHGTLPQHSYPAYGLDGGGFYGYGYGYGGGGSGGGGGGLGGGGSGGHKLSKERKYRMRVEAAAKLARAYKLDEIATSVATMQGASPIDDVASHVLARNDTDRDAQYVHFFHEKIPSRQLVKSTSLRPLDDIIMSRPHGADGLAETLRTRATVRSFKDDFEGATVDLGAALSSWRFGHGQPPPPPSPGGGAGDNAARTVIQLAAGRKRTQDVILDAASQPSSLEPQLLFHRAMAYLALACSHVPKALPEASTTTTTTTIPKEAPPSPTPVQSEARKAVKVSAKRALRDIMSFLSHFEYSPDLPVRVTRDFTERVNLAAHGNRNTRLSDPPTSPPPLPHSVYSLSALFAAVPPSGLPEIPLPDAAPGTTPRAPAPAPKPAPAPTFEAATFHPLLTDALHCLLLCHCLAQTSATELVRHAYMVARLARLADGYPVFQASRSPARSDWIEVMRKTHFGVLLSATWERLCAPAPLPLSVYDAAGDAASSYANAPDLAAVSAAAKKVIETLKKADSADSAASLPTTGHDGEPATGGASQDPPRPAAASAAGGLAIKRWSIDDGREYPILTERAGHITRWVRDVPRFALPGAKKKRRAGVSTKRPPASDTPTSSVPSGVDGGHE